MSETPEEIAAQTCREIGIPESSLLGIWIVERIKESVGAATRAAHEDAEKYKKYLKLAYDALVDGESGHAYKSICECLGIEPYSEE